MAESPVITCPECKKKFKGRGDLVGKKIKCPFCTKPFVVAASAPEKPKPKAPAKEASAAVKAGAGAAAPTPPTAPPAPAKPPIDEDDEPIGGSYGVGDVDIQYRCPNCANPMLNDEATICVYCGYNTLTREVGKTEKTFAVTGGQHVTYLMPGLVAAFFSLFCIYDLIWYCVVLPDWVEGTRMEFLSHESLRFWRTVIGLGILWKLGNICFKYFVLQPKPKEKKKED